MPLQAPVDRRRALPWLRGLFLLAALAARPSEALDPTKAITQYVHNVWQTDDGLPQNSVYATAQTRDGYLWLATQEGLVRFDGARFVVFDRRNTPELGNNFILSVMEDRAGRLWIGTGEGVVRYEAGVFTRFTARDGVPAGQVKSLLEDRRGRLFVGTMGGGLARLEGGRFVRESGTEALSTRRVQALIEDRDGVLWIGTETGLARLRESRLSWLHRSEGLTHDDISALYQDRAGAMWIGTTGGGLNRLEGGRITAFTVREGLSNDSINAIMEDRDGSLWVGARGGVNRMRDGRFTAFTTREGLSSEFVFSLQEDREGSLWIGTGGGGLNRLRDGRLTPWTTREGLTNDFARSFEEGRDGSLYIGTDGGGLNRLKDGRLTAITTKQGLSNDFVERVFEDAAGVLWIGTSGGGLNRMQDGRLTSFTTKQGLANDYVVSICGDHEGGLWVGTRGGLSHVKDGRVTPLGVKDDLTNDVVRALHEDRDGNLWIGTEGGGLNRLKEGRITSFTTATGLTSDNIVSIREDRDGTLWIGSRGGGLIRYRAGRFSAIGTRQGLFDDSVFAVLEDGEGRMWMSSNKGIFRADKAEIAAVMDGRRASLTSVAYGTADGMKSAEGNGSSSSGLSTKEGMLWFGTIGGAVRVDPKHLASNPVRPEVHIEEILLDGRTLDRRAPRAWSPDTRAIELHYTATSFLVPERVAFRYKLEGYDPDWVDAGPRRTAYYTQVPHGHYRFHVIASNDSGVWNEQGDAVAFEISPRQWETTPFRLGLLLLFASVLYAGHRLRLLSLRRRERELVAVVEERTRSLKEEKERTEAALLDAQQARAEAESANRTKSAFLATMSHELRTPLNAVLGFAQLMRRRAARDPEDLEHLAIIGRSGEHLLGLINDVLSLSRIEAGTVALSPATFEPRPMLEGLVQMLGVRARAKGLDLVLEAGPDLPEAVVGDEGKVRQILLNLLTNAIKFTARGMVTLGARFEKGEARFTVTDQGSGLTPAEIRTLFQPFVQTDAGRKSGEGTGLGLTISRSFARLMGGDIAVESKPGKGTVFTVNLPLPEAGTGATLRHREDRRRVKGFAPSDRQPLILIVDDVRENRLLLTRQMRSIGFQTREATDGAEAVERFEADHPELILMDVRMKGMDGLQATRAIRAAEAARGETRPVKIIALSASVLDDEIHGIRSSGCDDFLPKPFREGALFEKVAQLLDLRLIFEDRPAPSGEAAAAGALSAERLALVSLAARESLREAVRLGDDQLAKGAIEAIRAEDLELAEALARTLEEFRFDTLLRIVEDASS